MGIRQKLLGIGTAATIALGSYALPAQAQEWEPTHSGVAVAYAPMKESPALDLKGRTLSIGAQSVLEAGIRWRFKGNVVNEFLKPLGELVVVNAFKEFFDWGNSELFETNLRHNPIKNSIDQIINGYIANVIHDRPRCSNHKVSHAFIDTLYDCGPVQITFNPTVLLEAAPMLLVGATPQIGPTLLRGYGVWELEKPLVRDLHGAKSSGFALSRSIAYVEQGGIDEQQGVYLAWLRTVAHPSHAHLVDLAIENQDKLVSQINPRELDIMNHEGDHIRMYDLTNKILAGYHNVPKYVRFPITIPIINKRVELPVAEGIIIAATLPLQHKYRPLEYEPNIGDRFSKDPNSFDMTFTWDNYKIKNIKLDFNN